MPVASGTSSRGSRLEIPSTSIPNRYGDGCVLQMLQRLQRLQRLQIPDASGCTPLSYFFQKKKAGARPIRETAVKTRLSIDGDLNVCYIFMRSVFLRHSAPIILDMCESVRSWRVRQLREETDKSRKASFETSSCSQTLYPTATLIISKDLQTL